MRIATEGSKIDISSEKKLEEFTKNFIIELKKGDIFFLYGEVGVGKTTFVKYLINSLQINFKDDVTEVTSPTFNIMNEYYVGNFTIKHYDLFRLKSSKEIDELNLFNDDKNEILFIEWPEVIKNIPNIVTKLYFEYENQYQSRFIKIIR